MPHDKREPDMSWFNSKVEPPKLPKDSGLFATNQDHSIKLGPAKGKVKAPDPMAAAGIRIAKALQPLLAHEDPVAVLLALGLQIGATVARQSPPDLPQAMANVHVVARSELRRRRPGLMV